MLTSFFSSPFWQYSFLNNSLKKYFIFILSLIVLMIIFKIFQFVILKKLSLFAKKTKTDIDDALIEIVKSVRPPFYSFLAVYLALFFLSINPLGQKFINAVLIIWLTYQVIVAIEILINYLVNKKLTIDKEKDTKNAIKYIAIISKFILWILGLLLVLSNLGVNITSLIAGLGIGGIALALAVQNILEDVFSSLAIYFDKPFKVGDFIIVGEHKGTVEKIGIKTTRIKALQGEQIVISNKELTSARIQNFKKLQARRISFTIGIVYSTDNNKLEKIPVIIKQIIEDIELARFERSNFSQFADSALVFETVYHVLSDDYNKYMDINQEILLKIKAAFEAENIEMAYPTQTIHLAK